MGNTSCVDQVASEKLVCRTGSTCTLLQFRLKASSHYRFPTIIILVYFLPFGHILVCNFISWYLYGHGSKRVCLKLSINNEHLKFWHQGHQWAICSSHMLLWGVIVSKYSHAGRNLPGCRGLVARSGGTIRCTQCQTSWCARLQAIRFSTSCRTTKRIIYDIALFMFVNLFFTCLHRLSHYICYLLTRA